MARHDLWSDQQKLAENKKDQKWTPKPSRCSEQKTWLFNHLSQINSPWRQKNATTEAKTKKISSSLYCKPESATYKLQMTRHDMTWLLQWSKEICRKFIEEKGTRNEYLNPHGAQKIKHGHVTIWAKSKAVTERAMQDWSQGKEKHMSWMYTRPAKDASRVEFHDSVALAHWHVHLYPRNYSHSKNPGLLLLLAQPLRLCSPSSLQISNWKYKMIALKGLHLWPFLWAQVLRVS